MSGKLLLLLIYIFLISIIYYFRRTLICTKIATVKISKFENVNLTFLIKTCFYTNRKKYI